MGKFQQTDLEEAIADTWATGPVHGDEPPPAVEAVEAVAAESKPPPSPRKQRVRKTKLDGTPAGDPNRTRRYARVPQPITDNTRIVAVATYNYRRPGSEGNGHLQVILDAGPNGLTYADYKAGIDAANKHRPEHRAINYTRGGLGSNHVRWDLERGQIKLVFEDGSEFQLPAKKTGRTLPLMAPLAVHSMPEPAPKRTGKRKKPLEMVAVSEPVFAPVTEPVTESETV